MLTSHPRNPSAQRPLWWGPARCDRWPFGRTGASRSPDTTCASVLQTSPRGNQRTHSGGRCDTLISLLGRSFYRGQCSGAKRVD